MVDQIKRFYYLHTLFFLRTTWKLLELTQILIMQMTEKLGHSTFVAGKPTSQRMIENHIEAKCNSLNYFMHDMPHKIIKNAENRKSG